MPSLLGTLDLGARSLQTQQRGVEVAGHNIANVNNPAYARQRLQIETAPGTDTGIGPQGGGVTSVAIVRIRSEILDQEIQSEGSISGFLDAKQSALQYAESNLGQSANSALGTQSSSSAATGQNGIAAGLSDLFAAFHSLSLAPTSETERDVLVTKAADLAGRFNLLDQRLDDLQTQLNESLEKETASVNELFQQIAALNERIEKSEARGGGAANDLRDMRQERIESLSKLVNITVTEGDNLEISVAGTSFVSGARVLENLELTEAGDGRLVLRAANSGEMLNPTSGSLAGTIEARDGEISALRQNMNSLATVLIDEVNTIHRSGYNLRGGTGADFFAGTTAADIHVNPTLLSDPAMLQASADPQGPGDNRVALAMAGLADKPVASLGGKTFAQDYSQIVSTLGQALASVNTQVADQQSISGMLLRQRDSLSGVSLDEEMTDLMKYQRAFEASARLISVVDEMLAAVINMKQ